MQLAFGFLYQPPQGAAQSGKRPEEDVLALEVQMPWLCLDGSWSAMLRFMVAEEIEQWLSKFTHHHSWLAVTCEERQAADGEFWL